MKILAICICTHNRADFLRACLDGIARQAGLERADVLVVDNNCTDHTTEVVESHRASIPNLRIVPETEPGLSHARNRGMAEADASFIAYLDDDAIPEPGWLDAMLSAFEDDEADAVGGKVEPYWSGQRPWWISEAFYPLLGGVDYGPGVFVPDGFFCPCGANMAFRVDLLREMGGFDVRYGVCSVNGQEVNKYRGDDTDIGLRLAERGARVLYCSDAAVRHLTHGQSSSFGNIRRCARQQGWTVGVLDSFVAEHAEDQLVWFDFGMLSNLLRFGPRNALVFYFLALEKRAALREHHRALGSPYSLFRGWLRGLGRMRPGVLGQVKRTLFGRPVGPWGVQEVRRRLGKPGSPAISVVMPCYNQAAYLADAVGSLKAQTYGDWECIIVNDGSTDSTAEIGRDLVNGDRRVRYIEQINRGTGAARNRGVAESVGRYIQFLDADDTIAPSKFADQIEALEGFAEPALSYCDYEYCHADGTPDPDCVHHRSPVLDPENPLVSLALRWETELSIPIHSFLFDARLIKDLGTPFDPDLPNNEDWDCWMRVFARKPQAVYIDRKLAFYRLHGVTRSGNQARMRAGFLSAIRKQMKLLAGDQEMLAILKKKALITKRAYRDYAFPRSTWLALTRGPKAFVKAHFPSSVTAKVRREG